VQKLRISLTSSRFRSCAGRRKHASASQSSKRSSAELGERCAPHERADIVVRHRKPLVDGGVQHCVMTRRTSPAWVACRGLLVSRSSVHPMRLVEVLGSATVFNSVPASARRFKLACRCRAAPGSRVPGKARNGNFRRTRERLDLGAKVRTPRGCGEVGASATV